MTISREDFEIWRENPVTVWVMGVLTSTAEAAQIQAMQSAWTAPVVDQALIDRLKMRHETYTDIAALTFEAAVELDPQTPIPQEDARDTEGA